MAQKWPVMAKIPNFFFDPIWLCLTSIQLIGTRLFFFIKELRVVLLNKTLKMAIFQPKMTQKWPLMAKIPNFFYWSNMIMPYEYPVNWNRLILSYQGTTSRFIESKTLKIAIFQPKMAQKWPLMANIPKFFILIQYDYALQVSS